MYEYLCMYITKDASNPTDHKVINTEHPQNACY